MTRGWAVVTGASDGIGLECCQVLAARGYDLVLVARREHRLREVEAALTTAHGIAVRVVPCDLAAPHAAEALYRQIVALGIEVEFLVNNAGLLQNGYFDAIARDKQEDLLAVNIVALTALTHLFLPGMLARRRGYVLNVASTAAWLALPQQSVYAASKAYVLSFSLALGDELKAKRSGVVVTALCPGYTRTKMLDNPAQGPTLRVPKGMVLEPTVVAREGIDACLRGQPMAIPGRSNRVSMALLQCLPRVWVARVFGRLYRRGQA
jgi:uncharacterized protein